MRRLVRPLALVAALLLTPVAALAQSPGEIVSRMLERYRESTANIESLLVEQDIMGMASSVYMVKEVIDGHPVFVPRTTVMAGRQMQMPDDGGASPWTGSIQGFAQMAERFELEGTMEVDGRDAFCLAIEDFSGIDLGQPPDLSGGGQDTSMEPSRAVFYVDRERLVMLRMDMDAVVRTGDQESTVNIRSTFSDYRDVEGMLHPFLTSIAMEGMMDAMGAGDPDELRRQIDEMERQLESMSGPGKEFAERMMRPQIEQLREMLGGAPMEIRVNSVQANVPPPGLD